MSICSYVSESAARDRLSRLKASGQELVPQTFVGADGLLHVVLPDGKTDLVVVNDRPVYWVDVLDALAVYIRLYPDRVGAGGLGPFFEWHRDLWPSLRQAGVLQ